MPGNSSPPRWPPRTTASDACPPPQQSPSHLLALYLSNNREVGACPESDSAHDLWNGAGNDWPVGYGFNFVGLHGVRLASIYKPTATALFVESQWCNSADGACVAPPTAGVAA